MVHNWYVIYFQLSEYVLVFSYSLHFKISVLLAPPSFVKITVLHFQSSNAILANVFLLALKNVKKKSVLARPCFVEEKENLMTL